MSFSGERNRVELYMRIEAVILYGLPELHEGSCGPEAGCDAGCMDVASASKLLSELRGELGIDLIPCEEETA